MRALFAVVVVLLSGCAAVRGYTETAVQMRKEMNDQQAQLSVLALCDMSVGSFIRVLDDQQRTLVLQVCENGVSGR